MSNMTYKENSEFKKEIIKILIRGFKQIISSLQKLEKKRNNS